MGSSAVNGQQQTAEQLHHERKQATLVFLFADIWIRVRVGRLPPPGEISWVRAAIGSRTFCTVIVVSIIVLLLN